MILSKYIEYYRDPWYGTDYREVPDAIDEVIDALLGPRVNRVLWAMTESPLWRPEAELELMRVLEEIRNEG